MNDLVKKAIIFIISIVPLILGAYFYKTSVKHSDYKHHRLGYVFTMLSGFAAVALVILTMRERGVRRFSTGFGIISIYSVLSASLWALFEMIIKHKNREIYE